MPAFSLLASTGAPDAPAAIGWVLLSLAALAVVAERFFVLADRIKGKSPNVDAIKTFASKSDIVDLEKKVDLCASREDVKNMWRSHNDLSQSVGQEVKSMSRAIGRIEGALGTKGR